VLHDATDFSLFLLFLRQIISHRCLILCGKPGPPTVWRTQEQLRRPLFFRCFRLFGWKKILEPQKSTTAGDKSIAPGDGLRIFATLSEQGIVVK
jgi:hypothetical protein